MSRSNQSIASFAHPGGGLWKGLQRIHASCNVTSGKGAILYTWSDSLSPHVTLLKLLRISNIQWNQETA